jgi:hypothetical protein
MLGDNQEVVTKNKVPQELLNKQNNALAYHQVREMIDTNFCMYYWING